MHNMLVYKNLLTWAIVGGAK